MCTSQLPKPRPQKIVFLLQLVSTWPYTSFQEGEEEESARGSIVTVHWSCDRLCFVTKKCVISSLFINWKCSQQYLQGWSELTLVPKDVNLRKMLTSKVKITRVNWTGPQLLQRYATVKKRPNYRGEPAPEASGSSTMIALREMHASASGRIE